MTTPTGQGPARDDGPPTSRRVGDSPERSGSSSRRGRALGSISGEMAKPTNLEQELGVRLSGMPFSETFDNGKSSVIHRVAEPSVRQLVNMRHNDGQARGLYRLLTMPVRAAAKRAKWIPSGADPLLAKDDDEEDDDEDLTDFSDPTAQPPNGMQSGAVPPAGSPAPGQPPVAPGAPGSPAQGAPAPPAPGSVPPPAPGAAPPPDPANPLDPMQQGDPNAMAEAVKKRKRKAVDGEKEAEFAEALFNTPFASGGMQTPWEQVVAQMLLSVFDGFSAFEMVYTKPKKGPLEGKFALKKIAYRPAETVSFVVNDHGDFNGLKQRTYSPNGKYIDEYIKPENSIYIAMNEEENPFYGVSFFNAAFYHYDKKIKLYYLAHLAAQHRAVGSRLGKYPKSATPTELANFRKALSDFGLAQSVTVPDAGWTVEDLGKSLGDFPFMDFINHHNSQASKSVLAPFFDDQQGGQKSLVDFGDSSDSMYTMLIDVVVRECENLINNWIIPRFIDWNFGSYKYPKIKFGAFSDEQKKAIKETFDALAVSAAPNVTRPFLLELEKRMAEEMGLDIEYDMITEALKKQTDQTLEHFMADAAPPPNEQPFQAVGAAPADHEQGVAPTAQWMPGAPPPMDPTTGMPMPTSGPQGGTPPPPGRPPPPPGGGAPAVPPAAVPAMAFAPGMGGGAPTPPGRPMRRRGFPALPSQLQMTGGAAATSYLGTEDPLALQLAGDAAAIEMVMRAARGEVSEDE